LDEWGENENTGILALMFSVIPFFHRGNLILQTARFHADFQPIVLHFNPKIRPGSAPARPAKTFFHSFSFFADVHDFFLIYNGNVAHYHQNKDDLPARS